jgi:biotin transport system substrate-specific component
MTTRDLTAIALFAATTAVCAQASVAVPVVSPAPFTLQVFAVLASGAILGARRGFLSQVVYLLLGAAGVPVFARWHGGAQVLVGPTGGYLWAFPIAAFVAGWAWDRPGSEAVKGRARVLGVVAGLVCIYALGVAGLVATGTVPTLARAVKVGVIPFLVMDLIKAGLAVVIADRVRTAVPVLQAARDHR